MNALDLLLVVSVCTGTASGGPDRVYESPAPAGQVEVLSEGFAVVDRSELPLKAWKDCLRCPKFQCCDEIAMLRQL